MTDESGDSVRTALTLALEASVILAGPRTATPDELEQLERRGVPVVTDISGEYSATLAILDVWTNETDERVGLLRKMGVRTSCLADWLLERRRQRMVALTGTAGKSTTTHLVAQFMASLYGSEDVCSSTARAGNLWPTSHLLRCPQESLIVTELTSSHLAFCHSSPRVAGITNFWPDHLELHGGLEAYRAAKARLFDRQERDDVAVLPADDPEAAGVAQGSPARRAWFAEGSEPPQAEVRVWSSEGLLQVATPQGRRQRSLASLPAQFGEPVALRALLCALATSLAAATIWPARFDQDPLETVDTLTLPAHRRCIISAPGSALTIVDDTLAATPRKALAALTPQTHLVAGGFSEIGGRSVHSYEAEKAALEEWIGAIERCSSVNFFGPGGAWLARRLGRGQVHEDVLTALKAAVAESGGSGRVLVAPGFPMTQADRQAVARFRIEIPPPCAELPSPTPGPGDCRE